MLVIARIRLTKAFLGDMPPGRDGRRLFRKEGKMVQVNEQMWRQQFRDAARDIPMAVDTNAICPPRQLLPASYHIYTRNYSQTRTDQFESFRKGTILTIEFLLKEGPRAPTLAQFTDLLSFVGTWLGLSPWGSKFGYGRFELIEVIPSEQNESIASKTASIENPTQGAIGGLRGTESNSADQHPGTPSPVGQSPA